LIESPFASPLLEALREVFANGCTPVEFLVFEICIEFGF
jgi:hypothetical protein